jgi:tetratricopeptide (TPR) repeat protein
MGNLTQIELSQYMADTTLLTEESLPKLKNAMERYPYFASISLLYLKNLALLHDPMLETELARLAISVPDRKQLFLMLDPSGSDLMPSTDLLDTPQTVDTFSLIDDYLSEKKMEESEPKDVSALLNASASTDYLHWDLKKPQDEALVPIQLQHADLIDSFIENEQLRPLVLPTVKETSAVRDQIEALEDKSKDSFFTETLARIYVKQKRYEKALQIIQKLSLNYPEKNVYFADQISFLEKLIINTKK